MEIGKNILGNLANAYQNITGKKKSEAPFEEQAVKDIHNQSSVSKPVHNISHSNTDYSKETPIRTVNQMVQTVKKNLQGAINRLVGQSKPVEQRLVLGSKSKGISKGSEYYKGFIETNLKDVKGGINNVSGEEHKSSIQSEDYSVDERLGDYDNINDEVSEEPQLNVQEPSVGSGPQVEVSVGYVRGSNYGSEAEKKDKKVQTIYKSVEFTDDDRMMVEKERRYESGKIEVTTKQYKFRGEVLGAGTTGEARRYESIEGTKSKVIKVAFNAEGEIQIEKGYKILEKQHNHPLTNATLNSIPGIVKKNKFIYKKFSLQADYTGGDLSNVCGNMSASEYIDVMGQLLFGLKHMHTDTVFKPGMIHRDIKPGNILYRKNQYGMSDMDGAHGSEETHAKDVMVTNGYFSPTDSFIEQKMYPTWSPEQQRKFNAALDIYAMGMTFRELLTGQKGFYPNGNRISNFNFKYEDIKFKPGGEPSPAEEQQLRKMFDLIDEMTDSDWNYRPGSAQECFEKYASIEGITVPHYT